MGYFQKETAEYDAVEHLDCMFVVVIIPTVDEYESHESSEPLRFGFFHYDNCDSAG